MINLSWLIFPKVSRVVPAGGRGKDTGRRRRTRRKRGNTRRGQEEGRRRRDGEERRGRRRKGAGGEKGRLWVFGSHQPGQKKFGRCLELGALTLFFFFFFNQVICCLSFHRREGNREDTDNQRAMCMGPGQAAKFHFQLKVQEELIKSFQSWLSEPTEGHPRTLA